MSDRLNFIVSAVVTGAWVALYLDSGIPIYAGFATTSALITLAMSRDL